MESPGSRRHTKGTAAIVFPGHNRPSIQQQGTTRSDRRPHGISSFCATPPKQERVRHVDSGENLTRMSMNRFDYNEKRGFMSQYRYTVLFGPAEEGRYVVTCPALPGLVTEGNTYQEARIRAVEAIEGYLESLQKDGLPFPSDKKQLLEPVKEEINIALPEPA
jgi:predicted RNase H-like HicB family nuclease